MRIHKAGYSVILVVFMLFVVLNGLFYYVSPSLISRYIVFGASFLFLLFVFRFFRHPRRSIQFNQNQIISPADGKVVTIEEIEEDEFLNEKRIQISIFMSVWNVHINWFPVLGKVKQSLHFSGRYLAAWAPKSSTDNERCATVIYSQKGPLIVVKQIAGAVARRIITYSKPDLEIKSGDQLGFIRFGSRVDVIIPLNADIKVELDQKVKGGLTLLAEF